MLDSLRVSFTSREEGSTVTLVPTTATERFQRKLEQLLKERKRFDPKPKGSLADYCQRGASSWVSNMLHPIRATQPNLQDLENIADFFRISVNELLRPANPKDLSADEQRVVLAFRALPEPTRDHFLALVEAASVGSLSDKRGQMRKAGKLLTPRLGDPSSAGAALRPVDDPSAALQAIQGYLRALTLELGAIAAGVVPHRHDPPGDAQKPAHR